MVSPDRAVRHRRSRHLVVYWRPAARRAMVFNYATRQRAELTPQQFALLDFCDTWRSAAELVEQLRISHRQVGRLTDELSKKGLLLTSGQRLPPAEHQMAALDAWAPEAGFFHSATKDVPFAAYGSDLWHRRRRAAIDPLPSLHTQHPGRFPIALS